MDFDSTEITTKSHAIQVHFLNETQCLNWINYQNIDHLRKDAFSLYKRHKIDENNGILTFLDSNTKQELLLNHPSDILKTIDEDKHLFIHIIRPSCAMCSNSFGVLDDQQLLQCSMPECREQYCGNCIASIRGSSGQLPFHCVSCRKENKPERNLLIEKYIIWPRMAHTYGTENLLGIKTQSSGFSAVSILQDIELRRIHLQARLDGFEHKRSRNSPGNDFTESLIANVKELCGKCEKIISELKNLNGAIRKRSTVVGRVLDEYRKEMKNFDTLCVRLSSNAEELQMNDNNPKLVRPTPMQNSTDDLYAMQQLADLPSDQSISSIEKILEDIDFRKATLSSRIGAVTIYLPANTKDEKQVKKYLEKGTDKLKNLDKFAEELNCLRCNLRSVERWTDEYLKELSDDRQPDIPGSRFIYLLEMLRFETERLEVAEYFPSTICLVQEWQTSLDEEVVKEFKPKILDLCQSIESDLEQLFRESRSIYTVPYRIGVIGRTSVGKSALIMNLANLTHYSSMVNLERSTFGYLEFDAAFRSATSEIQTIPVCFVDIAGATDDQTSRSVGNYIDLIMNADCDVYMMVFDKPLDNYNQIQRDFVEKTLGRPCLLIRSKVDFIFNDFYRRATGSKFRVLKDVDYDIACVLQSTKEYCQKADDEKRIDGKVYMTAAGEDNELKDYEFGQFDLTDLKKHISDLACRDKRTKRVSQLASLAARMAINTCFRRGYTVCKIKYQWLAAGVSIIPFLDEIPAFLGREEIRQAFGVHERSSFTNTLFGTKNSLEDYLTQHELHLPAGLLKSGCFPYLVAKEEKSKSEENVEDTTTLSTVTVLPPQDTGSSSLKSKILGPTLAAAGVAGQLFDDAIRVAVPVTSGALRTASIVGIVLGGALTPLFAAWTFYNSGKRMNEHLHVLCDDFQIIMTYFILHVSNQHREMIQISSVSSDEENSSLDSSSDDD